MRLDKYLIEARKRADISEYVKILNSNCSEIIQVYKEANKFFYRGTFERGIFVEKAGRGTKVRIPRNTPPEFHRYLNKIFKEKFGWKVRDGISTTSQKGLAFSYGNGYIFFPTNRYKFAWSPKYSDLWIKLHILRTTGIPNMKEFLEAKKTTFTRAVNTYRDTGLAEAIKSGNEVMFKINKYYLLMVSQKIEEDLREALGMR